MPDRTDSEWTFSTEPPPNAQTVMAASIGQAAKAASDIAALQFIGNQTGRFSVWVGRRFDVSFTARTQRDIVIDTDPNA